MWWSESLAATITAEPLYRRTSRPTIEVARPIRCRASGSIPSSPTRPGSASSRASVSHVAIESALTRAATP
jgi:hypothetical protein